MTYNEWEQYIQEFKRSGFKNFNEFDEFQKNKNSSPTTLGE
jgi:hypothetical protein